MKQPVPVFDSLDQLERTPRIVTIGSFDGVHRGHQHLIKLTAERAQAIGLRSAGVTFEPIPAMVLRPEHFLGRVSTAADKLDLLCRSELQEIIVKTFSIEVAALSPESFMNRLVETTHLQELWVGESFALGKARVGDVERLEEIGAELGFRVVAIPRLEEDNEVISSSAIRRAIVSGDVRRAAEMLGRPFRIAGEVIHGAHLGRTIGYPTANVAPPVDLVALDDGIYVSLTWLPQEPEPRWSMTYVGTRPTVNTGARLIETHILDFDADVYGQVIQVDMLNRLRGDQTFDSLDSLITQLKKDEAATRLEFQSNSPIVRAGH